MDQHKKKKIVNRKRNKNTSYSIEKEKTLTFLTLNMVGQIIYKLILYFSTPFIDMFPIID